MSDVLALQVQVAARPPTPQAQLALRPPTPLAPSPATSVTLCLLPTQRVHGNESNPQFHISPLPNGGNGSVARTFSPALAIRDCSAATLLAYEENNTHVVLFSTYTIDETDIKVKDFYNPKTITIANTYTEHRPKPLPIFHNES